MDYHIYTHTHTATLSCFSVEFLFVELSVGRIGQNRIFCYKHNKNSTQKQLKVVVCTVNEG